MTHSWIIVADAAYARVFASMGASEQLQEVHVLDHPESQMHTRQLRTGGKGEVMDSAGFGQHQSDPQTSQSEKHAAHFARELCEFLHKQRINEAFNRLVLVAEPKMLGRLRANLDPRTAQMVAGSVDKNWVGHDVGQIEQLLKHNL